MCRTAKHSRNTQYFHKKCTMELASARVVYQNDGIDLKRDHLRQKDAVVDITKLTRERKHIILGSPPAMGKTSLLQLVKKEFLKDEGIKVLHRCLRTLDKVEKILAKLEKLGIKDDEDSSSDENGKSAAAETKPRINQAC